MTDTSRDAAALLRDFVNTLDVETGDDAIDTPGRLAAWLDGHDLVPTAVPAPGPASTTAGSAPGGGERDLDLARELREGLRTVMIAHHGPRPAASGADVLDGPANVLRGPANVPGGLEAAFAALPLRISLADGGPRLVPLAAPEDGRVREALAWIAAAVMESVADGTWGRLKVCQESTCRWAFLDTSKNRSRAWCSMRVCGNRTKTRAYRARLRTTGQAADAD
ncbi:zf-CGNR multi-domain protein [Actinomadura logoneensis]|uniref:Zf-CGNR multi-domain protein n=1 Tax=Actinomadura logoneensis TaxID=2293572 RepID=A0A372JJS6_9ACTN|nr:CGNR zinc finger domain-containing protein [Actinomadura logoneensis]RFU40277.1 zf-CGNR multi-domain protein [Actinomadura logoneensis]